MIFFKKIIKHAKDLEDRKRNNMTKQRTRTKIIIRHNKKK